MTTKEIRRRLESTLEELVTARVIEETRYVHGKLEEMRRERDALRIELESIRPTLQAEVDGFRVGDLVLWIHANGDTAPVEALVNGTLRIQGHLRTSQSMRRPPVRVGDTVRHVSQSGRGKVERRSTKGPRSVLVRFDNGGAEYWFESSALPIAPLNTP